MTDDLDRIMAVMDAAFDPAFGEAWTRRQVADALIMPNTHYLLAGADGRSPRDEEPAAGFALSRGAADEEELLLVAVDPDHRGRGIGGARGCFAARGSFDANLKTHHLKLWVEGNRALVRMLDW